MVRLGLCLACLILTGCAERGVFVAPVRAKEVSETVKTATELSDALGTPTVTIPLGNGKTKWIYQGVRMRPNAATYVPIVGLFAGGNDKKCTALTAVVDNETGQVSDFTYETLSDTDFILGKMQPDSCKKNADREKSGDVNGNDKSDKSVPAKG